MRVAVITPYYQESRDVLAKCHQSVAAQSHPCTHFMVADGHPRPEVSEWAVDHVILPAAHGDNGNTPRSIGSLTAINQGFDAIAYLDADNWFAPDHIASLAALHAKTGAAVCTSARTIHRGDGTFMYRDTAGSDGETFADTSCLFLTRAAFRLAPLWAMMPKALGPVCDRMIWKAIVARDLPRAHTGQATLAFRSQYAAHYRHINEDPPPGAKTNENVIESPLLWKKTAGNDEVQAFRRYLETGIW